MRHTFSGITTTAVVAAARLVGHVRFARAQERPYQGTFEGAGVDSAKRVLGVSMAVAAGYDDFLDTDPRIGFADQVQLPGYFVTLLPMASYQSKGTNLSVSAEAGSNGRYYNEAKRLVPVNHFATASITIALTPRTDLFIGQSASYSPAYL